MINLVQTSIPQADGSDRYVIIEPILEKDGVQGLRSTGVFKFIKMLLEMRRICFWNRRTLRDHLTTCGMTRIWTISENLCLKTAVLNISRVKY